MQGRYEGIPLDDGDQIAPFFPVNIRTSVKKARGTMNTTPKKTVQGSSKDSGKFSLVSQITDGRNTIDIPSIMRNYRTIYY